LGKFRDDDILLRAAAVYVSKPPAVEALGMTIYTATGRIGTKVRRERLAKIKQGVHGRKRKK
jgi:hypothetical protein